MKRTDIPGLRRSDRAFELEDGRRVVVEIRRKILDRSGAVALTFRLRPVDVVSSGPCCPARTHTISQEALASGAVDLESILEAESAEAVRRWCEHSRALEAVLEIEEEVEEEERE